MKELIKEFSEFLAEEYRHLTRVKVFLMKVPRLIGEGEIDQIEFQNFLEKYEVQNSHFINEKKRFNHQIAEKLNIEPEEVSLSRLVRMGYRELNDIGHRVVRISNDISMLLLKISIFLKNFSRMQQEFKRLNHFLHQNDYSPRGVAMEPVYRTGRNFYGEA